MKQNIFDPLEMGYANFSFNGPALHIAYYDLQQSRLLTEDWRIDLDSGALEGPNLKKVLDDSSLHCRYAQSGNPAWTTAQFY